MLENIRVVDFSRVLSGPFCTRMLSDLGAEIIKVETLNGDPMRKYPPFKGPYAYYFSQFNVGKKSLCVDLRHATGVDLVKKLVAKCDVVLENFRPGLLAEMGLGYPVLRETNPAIIYCAISGFGQEGPDAKRLAYTDIIQAYGGMDHAAANMIDATGDPPGFPFSFADTYASFNAAIAILAALYHRQFTGQGQAIDISMLDCVLAANDTTIQKYIFSDGRMENPGWAFRPPIKMKDGHMAVSFALAFERMAKAIGRHELLHDELFETIEARMKNFDIFMEIVKEWAMGVTIEEASKIFDLHDIPYARVNRAEEIVNHPTIRHRNMLPPVHLPGVGDVPIVNTPFKFNGGACGPQGPPPLLGEHNQTVLGGILGLSAREIEELAREGVISAEAS
jgi:crotonobetainyl-CoA:carnitine CoA-transferase CaiB-like acyl-CoA transferase